MPLVRRAILLFRHLLTAFALLFLLVSFTPLVSWWASLLAKPWHTAQGDVLIVLAGSHQGDTIGESSYIRALYAVRAYREWHHRKIFISGQDSAPAMREFLVGQSVPLDRIEIETDSTSTLENVQRLKPLLQREMLAFPNSRLVLLTSDYHIYRSVRLFHRAGLAVQTSPAPDALKRAGFWEKRWPAFIDLFRETAKIGFYHWKGWL